MPRSLKKFLDMITSVGAICAIIIFFTIVSRVMVDVVQSIWSRSFW